MQEAFIEAVLLWVEAFVALSSRLAYFQVILIEGLAV